MFCEPTLKLSKSTSQAEVKVALEKQLDYLFFCCPWNAVVGGWNWSTVTEIKPSEDGLLTFLVSLRYVLQADFKETAFSS